MGFLQKSLGDDSVSHYMTVNLTYQWISLASLSVKDLDFMGDSLPKHIFFSDIQNISVWSLLILLPSKYDLWMENMEGTHATYVLAVNSLIQLMKG
jgi:hypothetical protein